MLIIPHKKIKSHSDTLTYLLDPARLRTFIIELRASLKSTQHLFQKEGCDNDPRQCVHRQLYNRPETVMFRRINHFCYERSLDWEGARAMMELMLSDRFMCDCEMLWRYSDEQVEERLAGRRR